MSVQECEVQGAVEIADRVWWVGHVLQNDPFQCHVYLIENAQHSILIDPGSKLTWRYSREKILSLMPLENIKYIICHHQDPDIVSCIEDLLQEIGTEGRLLITHWRAKELLEHYDWGIDFYEIQENAWRLECEGRSLEFVFTPYMHFPGAFCTYDRESKILFSSDIFGAITEKFSLFASDAESYFRMMEPFHTHYMPASVIVNNGLDNIEKCQPLKMIAPQHGSIIKEEFIPYIIERLRTLKCGLYLEFGGVRDIELMIKINNILPRIYEEVSFFYGFSKTSKRVVSLMKVAFPIHRIAIVVHVEEKGYILFDSKNPIPTIYGAGARKIGREIENLLCRDSHGFFDTSVADIVSVAEDETAFVFPLAQNDEDIEGVGIFIFNSSMDRSFESVQMLGKFETAVTMMGKHELEIYRLENEKKKVYTMAITDKLTGLYNRHYFDETAAMEIEKARLHANTISLAYLDLDHFKSINDSFGHEAGDIVLRHFSQILKEVADKRDTLFRIGGEEFVIIMPDTNKMEAFERVKEIKKRVACSFVFVDPENIHYTFSCGICDSAEEGYVLSSLLKVADMKLYKAKLAGRDRIIF
jgi:diguanylate cyclase (GGDEF)-like protein